MNASDELHLSPLVTFFGTLPPQLTPLSSPPDTPQIPVGAGMLALPFFFRETGYVAGIAVLALVAVVAGYSLDLLVRCAHITNAWSYLDVALATFGRTGSRAVELNTLLLTFGAASAYLIVIGSLGRQAAETVYDLVQPPPSHPPAPAPHGGVAHGFGASDALYEDRYAHLSPWLSRSALTAVVLAFPVLPLCCLRNIGKLSFTSMLSMLAVAWLVLLVVGNTVYRAAGDHPPPLPSGDHAARPFVFAQGFFFALPTVGLAFTSHPNIYEIISELERPTPRRISVCIWGTTALCFCMPVVFFFFRVEISGDT